MKLTKRTLHLQAKPCKFDYPVTNLKLANDMVEFMKKENGIGLSATQIGLRQRLFVMNINGKIHHCFNPEILNYSDEKEILSEGCLSFPGDECKIQRAKSITVSYTDATGITASIETLDGIAARCFQHELDHLNGTTMHQRLKEQNAK